MNERLQQLHKQSRLHDDNCGKCEHLNALTMKPCEACPVLKELQVIGKWLTADMQSHKPAALREVTKAKKNGLSFTQADYSELRAKNLGNAEIAHLYGVSIHTLNKYKTKHKIYQEVGKHGQQTSCQK